MEFRFKSKKLESLYFECKGEQEYGAPVVKAFFKVMAIIDNAVDERDIRAFKALRYENLKGDRNGQSSVRLNDQWRLIFEIRKEGDKYLLVIEIADYH
jgi:proteic killer suppression protein